jgi:hypothetical protein
MGKRKFYHHSELVDVDVDVPISNVLKEADTEDLLAELRRRSESGQMPAEEAPNIHQHALDTLRELTRAASEGDHLHVSVMEARLRSMILPARLS